MSLRSWLKPRGRVHKPIPEVSDFDVTAEDIAAASAVPMESEVRAAQTDYLQKLLTLGRTSANARRILAEQTLVNVQGKMRHVPHPHR